MSQIYINKRNSKTKIMIAMLIVGVVIITGFLYWHNRNTKRGACFSNAITRIQHV